MTSDELHSCNKVDDTELEYSIMYNMARMHNNMTALRSVK